MVLKIVAIAALVLAAWWFAPAHPDFAAPPPAATSSLGMLAAIGAAMTPVMFAYGGWQTASFVAAEMRDPAPRPGAWPAAGRRRRGARSIPPSPSSASMRSARTGLAAVARRRRPTSCGWRSARRGATLIALGIAISALGFLSQGMLTAPRVYFAMAEDGLFFRKIADVNAAHATPRSARSCCRARRRWRSPCRAPTGRS